jgi:SYP5 family syntaxin
MASPSELWMQEFNEASKLGDEISNMISGKNSLPQSGPETQRHLSAIRRKATILTTKLDILQSLLSALPSKQSMYVFPSLCVKGSLVWLWNLDLYLWVSCLFFCV